MGSIYKNGTHGGMTIKGGPSKKTCHGGMSKHATPAKNYGGSMVRGAKK